MSAWLDQALACLDQHTDIILITVAQVRGSAPRNATTRMLVSAGQQWLTIGGGNLEWQAVAKAKAYLQQAQSVSISYMQQTDQGISYSKKNIWFDVFQLAASLGQCCGGVVGVVFEHLSKEDIPWLEFLRDADNNGRIVKRKLTSLAASDKDYIYDVNLALIADSEIKPIRDTIYKQLTSAQKKSSDNELSVFKNLTDGNFDYTEYIEPEYLNIYVFGAGHVGKALVHILATLPCRVFWVDNRSDQFPEKVAANVSIEDTDIPESIIESALPNSCYVIMTYDHALDQRLCEQLMKRDDALYFGLIGSRTKRTKFEQRFKAKGIDASLYEKMICPIGIPEIKGKQPAMIALAVAAELMSLRNKGYKYA